MGNPIPGATTPPPVTVTMARYVPLNIRYTFAMLGQANIWRKSSCVQRTVEGRDTTCVLVAPRPLARRASGLTLVLNGQPHGAGPPARFQPAPGGSGGWATTS